jgi:hypothetical protein
MAVPEPSKLVGDLRSRLEDHDPYPRPLWLLVGVLVGLGR